MVQDWKSRNMIVSRWSRTWISGSGSVYSTAETMLDLRMPWSEVGKRNPCTRAVAAITQARLLIPTKGVPEMWCVEIHNVANDLNLADPGAFMTFISSKGKL